MLVCGSLIHWHLKASIISHLSVDVQDIPFATSTQLLESDYQIVMLKDTAPISILENAPSGIFKQLWDTKFLNKDLSLMGSTTDIIAEASRGYTMCVPTWEVYASEEYKTCLISDTGYSLFSFKVAFAFTKYSPFRDLFNHALQMMVESGELEKIKLRYKTLKPDCSGSRGRSIGFENAAFAFLIFFGGLASSIIVLIVELITRKK